jgi:hypothetical protein
MALRYGLDDRWFESRRGLGIFLFTTTTRTALGPTQPPIQWVPASLSLGVKRPGSEADRPLPPSGEVKNAWSYITTLPISLHGVVLSLKAQGQLCLLSFCPVADSKTVFCCTGCMNLLHAERNTVINAVLYNISATWSYFIDVVTIPKEVGRE